MWVNQAFRFELSPNEGQRKALAQHIGAARFAYNWGLEMALKARAEGRRIPSAPELHKAWNVWKRENPPGGPRSPSALRRRPSGTWRRP
jgi:putative transposase